MIYWLKNFLSNNTNYVMCMKTDFNQQLWKIKFSGKHTDEQLTQSVTNTVDLQKIDILVINRFKTC